MSDRCKFPNGEPRLGSFISSKDTSKGAALGLGGPSIVLLTGMAKEFRTTFSNADYKNVRRLGEEYRSRSPRSTAT